MGDTRALVSIVVPVYNEQENVEHFYDAVKAVMEKTVYAFEILYIDDGSTDCTTELIRRLSERDERVRGYFFARNFGHQIALCCGLDHADGDAVVTMDVDMQHPPEMLPDLLAKWEEGYEVVQTVRETTEGVSRLKNFTSECFYRVMNAVSKIRIYEGGSDFRLLDKKVVASFRRYGERARFIRGMISAIGYRQTTLRFVAPKRFAGVTKFSPRKMMHFALDGITAYSHLPLRLSFYVGIVFALISFTIVAYVIGLKLFTTNVVPLWTPIAACGLFLGGVQMMVMGVIGEYIGRIYEEVKQRPLYLVRETVGQARRGRGEEG